MTYIAFDGDKLYNGGESDGWLAYRYLCPKATNPWMTISENSAGEKYGINIATAVRLADRPYKHAYFFIASAIKEIGPPDIIGLYVACKPRRATFRSVDDIVNTFPQSDELNPNSVGEDIAHIICSSLGHK